MIFLLSDTHFNHHFLINQGLRLAEFDIKLWRAIRNIPASAWFIHLGDVSLGHDNEIHRKVNLDCLAQQRILVRGNHDQRALSWYLGRGWSHVTDGMIINRFGKTILFTHEPKHPLPSWIDVNIHGHLHTGVHRKSPVDDRHILISCEKDGYTAMSLEKVIGL